MKKFVYITGICFLLFTTQGYGQLTPEKMIEEEAHFKTQIKEGSLSDEEIGSTFLKFIERGIVTYNDIEVSRKYAYEALSWAKKKDLDFWEASFLHRFALSFWNIRQLDSADVYLNRALEITEGKYPEIESKIYLTKGAICQFKQEYECAISCYFKVQELVKLTGNERLIVSQTLSCNINIGIIYDDFGNKSHAEEYLLKAVDIYEKYKDKYDLESPMYSAYYSLAVLYKNMNNGEEALRFITESYEIAKKKNMKAEMVLDLTILSRIYLINFNNKEEALKYAEESLKVAEETGITYYILIAEQELMIYYLNTSNEREALKYAQSALAKTDPTDLITLAAIHYCLVGIHAGLGNLDKVEEHLNKYRESMERLADENMHNAIQDIMIKYDTQQKELEISRQQTVITRQNTHRVFLLGGLTVTIIVLSLLWMLLRARTKRSVMLAKMNNMLTEMNVTKDKFFTIISHDLKNPAIAQHKALKRLVDHKDSFDVDSLSMYLAELLKSSDNQVKLLLNLLNWAQLQTDRMPYTPTTFEFVVTLRPEISLIKSMAETKGVTLTEKIPNEAVITGDSNILLTVVRNLLTNAVKFTPEGGEVLIDLTINDNGYTVSVSDTGIGMSDEQLQDLYRIDSRQSKTGTAGEQGSGLGLIVCKELIEKHGGKLEVESSLGKGSRFWFTISNF